MAQDQRFLADRVVISGPPAQIAHLEKETILKNMIARHIGTELTPIPQRGELPSVYAHNGKAWQKSNLEGGHSYKSFQAYRHSKGVLTRSYNFSQAEGDVRHKLKTMLNKPNELNMTGFDIAPDHIVKHNLTGGHPVGSPWKIPARTLIAGDEAAKLFSTQPFWQTIGCEGRAGFKPKGAGVTIVIMDTAPALDKINPTLVDYYIALREPGDEALPIIEPDAILTERYCLPRATPVTYERPGDDDIEAQVMVPYHGLLIASLIREIAPKATIILLEVLNDDGETTGSNLTEAMDFVLFLREKQVLTNGKRLVNDKLVYNLSLGIPRTMAEEAEATYLLEACQRICESGALIVAAAGNDSYYLHPRNPEEPSAYGYFHESEPTFQQIIAVSATGPRSGEYALYSNQGNLAAPGMDLLMDTGTTHSFDKDGISYDYRYVYWAGTSFATPLVAGVTALLLEAGVAPTDIKQRLWTNANQPQRWNDVPEINVSRTLQSLKAM